MLCRKKAWGEAPCSSSFGDEWASCEFSLMWQHKILDMNMKSEMENRSIQSSPNQRRLMKSTCTISSVAA